MGTSPLRSAASFSLVVVNQDTDVVPEVGETSACYQPYVSQTPTTAIRIGVSSRGSNHSTE